MLRQDLDLTIVTREPGNEVGQLLRQERLVWAAAEGFCPQEQRPMPLALFNSDCFCRAWTCNALEPRASITASPTPAPAWRRSSPWSAPGWR
jgi:hypothetical protein